MLSENVVEFCSPEDIKTDLIGGLILSQHYPNPYNRLVNCNITILPADHELSMEIFVHEFHTERFFDFLRIVSSYGTYTYHGNGANIGSFPEAMEEGATYYCK